MATDVTDLQTLMRLAAFERVRQLGERKDHLTADALAQGFAFQGVRYPLFNPRRGIFKPREMRHLLSIRTVFPKSGNRVWYDDQRDVHRQVFEGDEAVDYAFMGENPDAADNRWLQQAHEHRVPLIYFLVSRPGATRQSSWLLCWTGIGHPSGPARAAVEAGWRVALAARSADRLDAMVRELEDERACAIPTDVTDWEDQQRMATRAMDRFGRIDGVFANAGVGGEPGGFSGAPPESWRKMVDVNILGVAYTLRATLAHVKAARGQVVITGSVAGRRVIAGSMYAATKWAVSAIGYALREELRGSGVRVMLLEPGIVDTPFFDQPKPDGLRPEDVARSVLHALTQPPGVDIHELVILPTAR